MEKCTECGKKIQPGDQKVYGEAHYSGFVYCMRCWDEWNGRKTKPDMLMAHRSSEDDSASETEEPVREIEIKKPSSVNGFTPQATASQAAEAPRQPPELDLAPRAEEEPRKASARPRGAFSRQTQPSASPKDSAKDSGLQQGRPQRKGAFSVQHKAHQLMQKIETLDKPSKDVASKADVLAVPEEQAAQSPSEHDGCVLPASDAWLGLWKYGQKPTVYRIVQVDEEKLQFEGRYSPGDIAVSGVLEPQSEHLMAELMTAGGDCVGSIKLRYDPEKDNIVSNFKTALKTDWGNDIRAERTTDEEIAQARADQGKAERTTDEEIAQARADQGKGEPCEASVAHSEPGPASTDTATHADQDATSTLTVQQQSLAMKQMLQKAKADSGSGLDHQGHTVAPVEVPHPTPAEHPAPVVQSEAATAPSATEPVPASAPQQQLDGKKEEAQASSDAAHADASGAHRAHQPLGAQAEEPPVSTAVADPPSAEAEVPPMAVAAPLPAKAEMPSTAVAAAPPAKAEMPSTAVTAAPPAKAEMPSTAVTAAPPAKAEVPPTAAAAAAPPAKAEMPPTAVTSPLPAKAEAPPPAVAAPLPAKAEVPSTAAAASPPAKAELPPTAVAASPPAKAGGVAAPPPSKAEVPPTTVAAPLSEKAVIPHPAEAKQPHPAPLGTGEGCASAAAPSATSPPAAAKPAREAAEPSAPGGQRQLEEDTVEITVKVKLRVPASSRMREVKQAFVQKLGQTKGASKIKMYQTSNESISVCADADLLDLKQDLFAEGVKIVTDKIEPAELAASPSSSAKDTGAKLAQSSPHSTAQSGRVQVVVRDSNRGDVQVDLPASATVLEVKKAVAIKLGHAGPGSVQLLISNGKGCNKCIDSDPLGSTREFLSVGDPPASP